MGIPYNWADRGAGEITRIIMGNNSHGTDIFVRPDQLEDAKALLYPDLTEDELAAMSEDAADTTDDKKED